MRIAIGADHAGFELKEHLVAYLRNLNQQILDLGTHNTDRVDYPDSAEAVGEAIRDGRADRGILICCSGCRCIGGGDKAAWHPCRALSRYVFSSPGGGT